MTSATFESGSAKVQVLVGTEKGAEVILTFEKSGFIRIGFHEFMDLRNAISLATGNVMAYAGRVNGQTGDSVDQREV